MTPARHRIEMVLPSMEMGGMETMVLDLMDLLAARGHEVGLTCVVEAGILGDAARERGHRLTVVSSPGVLRNWNPVELCRWFRELRPSVVHVHSGAWPKAARGARLAGVLRVVYTAHGSSNDRWLDRRLMRMAARHTSRVIAVSEPLRAYLRRLLRGRVHDVDLIVNGINTDAFAPGGRSGVLRERFAIPDDAPIVGSVARLVPVKDHVTMIEAFAHLRRRLPNAVLVLVGDGPERSVVEQRVRQLELEGAVHLFGETTGAVAPLYRDFDVFWLTSRSEGTSISLLEAMAAGVPVVATAVGGNPDLVGHGEWGMLVQAGDASAIAAAAADLLTDRDRARRLSARARCEVTARYGRAAMVQNYERVYAGLGSADATPGAPRRGE